MRNEARRRPSGLINFEQAVLNGIANKAKKKRNWVTFRASRGGLAELIRQRNFRFIYLFWAFAVAVPAGPARRLLPFQSGQPRRVLQAI